MNLTLLATFHESRSSFSNCAFCTVYIELFNLVACKMKHHRKHTMQNTCLSFLIVFKPHVKELFENCRNDAFSVTRRCKGKSIATEVRWQIFAFFWCLVLSDILTSPVKQVHVCCSNCSYEIKFLLQAFLHSFFHILLAQCNHKLYTIVLMTLMVVLQIDHDLTKVLFLYEKPSKPHRIGVLPTMMENFLALSFQHTEDSRNSL